MTEAQLKSLLEAMNQIGDALRPEGITFTAEIRRVVPPPPTVTDTKLHVYNLEKQIAELKKDNATLVSRLNAAFISKQETERELAHAITELQNLVQNLSETRKRP